MLQARAGDAAVAEVEEAARREAAERDRKEHERRDAAVAEQQQRQQQQQQHQRQQQEAEDAARRQLAQVKGCTVIELACSNTAGHPEADFKCMLQCQRQMLNRAALKSLHVSRSSISKLSDTHVLGAAMQEALSARQQPAQQPALQPAAAGAAPPRSTPPQQHHHSAGTAAASPDGGRLIAAASALQEARACSDAWAAAEGTAEAFRKDATRGAARRKGDKFVTLNVQQIAATQEQVCFLCTPLQLWLRTDSQAAGASCATADAVVVLRHAPPAMIHFRSRLFAIWGPFSAALVWLPGGRWPLSGLPGPLNWSGVDPDDRCEHVCVSNPHASPGGSPEPLGQQWFTHE